MFSAIRPSEPTATSSPPKAGPKFPIYLLPSFTMPFRRRQSSTAESSSSSSSSPPHETAIPILSSSPTDSVLSSPVESLSLSSGYPSRFSFSHSDDARDRRASVAEPLATKLARTHPDTIRCSTCATDFAFCSQVVSKGFTGRYGRAYLISAPEPPRKGPDAGNLLNVRVGKPETRLLVTGSHTVADITCVVCQTRVGWKYIDAKEESQKYKIGKFILETQRIVDYRSWEDIPLTPEHLVAGDEFAVNDLHNNNYKDVADDDEDPEILFDSDDEDECEDLFSGTWDPQIAAKRRARKVGRQSKASVPAAV